MTKEQILEYIKENKDKMSNKEMADVLGVPKGTIGSLMCKNNLKREYKLELLEGEIFKSIPELNNKYKVSNYGRIINNENKLMKPFNAEGYNRITLSPNKKEKEKFFVHRLVALAFIPREKGKDFVNHKDMNKKNNHVSNLEWVTQSENEKHKMINNSQIKSNLSDINKSTNSVYKTERIKNIHGLCQDLKNKSDNTTYDELSKKHNIDKKTISAIKNKRMWKSISDLYF